MASAEQVLKVARSQIGYCESPAGSNRTKYGKFFGMNGVPWCSEFLYWCFQKAGAGLLYPHNASTLAQDDIVSKCGGTWIMRKNKSASVRKAYLKKAKPGDVVCFSFKASSDYRYHISNCYRSSLCGVVSAWDMQVSTENMAKAQKML